MIVYLRSFNNKKQNYYVKFLLISQFEYKDIKNINTSHSFFEFAHDYHLYISFKINIDFYSKFD